MAVRGNKAVGEALVASYKDDGTCPVPTTDVALNLKNRNYAIEEHGYGPLNPAEPNPEFWRGIADLWGISSEDAKTSRCSNCAAFIQTPKMLECIKGGLGYEDDYPKQGADHLASNRTETLESADLGYCQLFGFKCAGDRVCRAWLHGGPIK